MLKEVNRHAINRLIDYYQTLNSINTDFNDIADNDNKETNYQNLIEQLIKVREFLINKSFDDINAIYRPMANLFIYKEHYAILEETIQFFKVNVNEVYPVSEEKSIAVINEDANTNVENDSQQPSTFLNNNISVNQSISALHNRLSNIECSMNLLLEQNNAFYNNEINDARNQNILSEVAQIKDSFNKVMNNDFCQSLIKSSHDLLTTVKTNFELTKSDLIRYDSLLTEHINKSNINISESMEKEHARFTHKISSDVNAVVSEITKANANELANHGELIKTNMAKLEDRSLRWFFFSSLVSAFLMFTCSWFSSFWAGNKVITNARIFKIVTACAPDKPKAVSHPHKNKHDDSSDD